MPRAICNQVIFFWQQINSQGLLKLDLLYTKKWLEKHLKKLQGLGTTATATKTKTSPKSQHLVTILGLVLHNRIQKCGMEQVDNESNSHRKVVSF